MNSGDITLAVGIATLVVNTIAAIAAVKAIRKPKRRGRHRKE
ncbi:MULTISPECIES: hypothetical protein [unclassified Streptomyces]